MAVPTRDRAAVLDYIGRLGKELGEERGIDLSLSGSAGLTEADVQARVDQLAGSRDVDEEELKSLESVIRSALRPMVRLEEDRLPPDTEEMGPWRLLLADHAQALERAAQAVGRILLRGHPSLSWVGSGFHVGNGLVLTTKHVATIFAEVNGQPSLRSGLEVAVEFSSTTRTAHPVSEVMLIHPELDIAIVRAEGIDSELPALTFDGAEGVPRDRDVAVIGYGSGALLGEGADPLLHATPAAKLVSLGRIIGYENVVILGEDLWCLAHDCSTQPGFAGGPVVDAETGFVIGVNFASQSSAPGILVGGGFAVPASELARDSQVRHLGLPFTSGSPQPQEDPGGADGTPEASTAAEPAAEGTSADLLVDQVTSALVTRFEKRGRLDEPAMIEFIEGLGDDYALAVAVQPGRGLIEPEAYCEALVIALQRRGLITPEFLGELGLLDQELLAPRDASAPEPAAAGEEAGEQSRRIGELLSRLDIPRDEQLSFLVGSPYWDKMTGGADEPPDLSELVERLAADGSEEARAALSWLEQRLQDGASTPGTSAAQSFVPSPWEMVGLAYFRAGLEAAKSIGRLTTSSKAGSTCWLIAPDLVVAPAHVMGLVKARHGSVTLAAAAKSKELAEQRVVVEFDDEEGKTHRAGVRDVAFFDHGLDIMLVRLKRASAKRLPLQIRTDLVSSGPIASIHHPQLQQKMVSVHGGRLISNDGHEVKYVLATGPGVAGAPVFDANWQVIATHRARLPIRLDDGPPLDGKLGTSVAAMIQRIRETPSLEKVWRQITAAQQALKSVDPGLQAGSGRGQTQRLLIELVDSETRLARIPGLRIVSRLGRIVTATATPRAIKRLSEQQGVVSLKASRAGGAIECLHSMPFIGVDKVRKDWDEAGDQALIAVIDSGIDMHHETFLDDKGHTRIIAFWDQQDRQVASGEPSATMSAEGRAFAERYGLRGGALYVASDIEAIRSGRSPAPPTLPAAAKMDHGTIVCSIAAGRGTGNGADDFAGGVAPGAKLVVIRYDLADASVGYSLGHVSALAFVDSLATELKLPVVVNISNGMNGGAHDGKSEVEIACGEFCRLGTKPGRVIVKSAGNERDRRRHAELTVPTGAVKLLRFYYDAQAKDRAGRDGSELIQVWMPYMNQYEFKLISPANDATPLLKRDAWSKRVPYDGALPSGNVVRAAYADIEPENGRSLLQLDLAPGTAADLESGRWTLEIKGVNVQTTEPLRAWIELNSRRTVYFLDGTVNQNTITVPGTTEYVITVGAVELTDELRLWDHSSAGPTLANLVKPDLVAPGVDIVGAGAGLRRSVDSRKRAGTSLAAPHVAGSIALVLSAWAKVDPGGMPNMLQVRQLLLNSLAKFNVNGDPELGHGRLDTKAFYEMSRPR